MKGKLIINHSINVVTLADDIVIQPKCSVNITMAQYYNIYQTAAFKNYLAIKSIVCYDTTIPSEKKKAIKEPIQDNRLNIKNNNTIIKEDNTTNNVNVSVSETTKVDDVTKSKKEVVKVVEEKPATATETKTNTSTTSKKRSGRKKKSTTK